MATRSTIGVLNGDGSVTSIYCHWDGYPEYNGHLLAEHYTSDEKIATLMALGDLSSLGAEIGTQKPFNTGVIGNECMAYGRDRGETGVEAVTHPTVSEWMKNRARAGCEYGYLWEAAGWKTFSL